VSLQIFYNLLKIRHLMRLTFIFTLSRHSASIKMLLFQLKILRLFNKYLSRNYLVNLMYFGNISSIIIIDMKLDWVKLRRWLMVIWLFATYAICIIDTINDKRQNINIFFTLLKCQQTLRNKKYLFFYIVVFMTLLTL
jgi:hypothetical protein